MSKPFLNPRQQVQHLIVNKGLIIPDPFFAERKLRDIEYASLIGGYKTPFINPMTRKYENNTTFEDILALYQFDKELRLLTFGVLNTVEEKVRQLISDAFCSRFGEKQSAYLDSKNYRPGKKWAGDVQSLIDKHLRNALKKSKHDYIKNQKVKYNEVPLWYTVKLLTFGELSVMYSVLQIQQQTAICKAFPATTAQELVNSLNCLTYFRNVCAHNERLYSYKLYQHDFNDTALHAKLCIAKKGTKYVQGKNDYFGLVLTMRYLLPREEFLAYKAKLLKLIHAYFKKSTRMTETDLLSRMGFPMNWEKMTRYKL